jgi:hypothetical protein
VKSLAKILSFILVWPIIVLVFIFSISYLVTPDLESITPFFSSLTSALFLIWKRKRFYQSDFYKIYLLAVFFLSIIISCEQFLGLGNGNEFLGNLGLVFYPLALCTSVVIIDLANSRR